MEQEGTRGNRKEFDDVVCGGVVQLVRTPACHAGGRGFESRRSRFRHPAAWLLASRARSGAVPSLPRLSPSHRAPSCEFVGHLEVAKEGHARLDGGDGTTVLPEAVEEGGEDTASLGRRGF